MKRIAQFFKVSYEECAKLLEKEGVHVEKAAYVENALEISGYDSLRFLESFEKGYFQVQDVSSMLVGLAANPKPGDNVILRRLKSMIKVLFVCHGNICHSTLI